MSINYRRGITVAIGLIALGSGLACKDRGGSSAIKESEANAQTNPGLSKTITTGVGNQLTVSVADQASNGYPKESISINYLDVGGKGNGVGPGYFGSIIGTQGHVHHVLIVHLHSPCQSSTDDTLTFNLDSQAFGVEAATQGSLVFLAEVPILNAAVTPDCNNGLPTRVASVELAFSSPDGKKWDSNEGKNYKFTF